MEAIPGGCSRRLVSTMLSSGGPRHADTVRHTSAFNNNPVASQEALETSNDRFERAEELKADFREKLNS